MSVPPSTTLPARCLTLLALLLLAACSGSDKPAEALPAAGSENPISPQQSASTDTTAPPPPRLIGERRHGEATYYNASGKGNCSFDADDKLMVAAINTTDYANAAMCGAYLAVTGPQGSVTVRIVDRCPGCQPGGLDLSKQAFQRIAATTNGRIPISWQIVAGPTDTPVSYHYLEGTTRYWTAVQVRHHRWPIAKLEILPNGATEWLSVERRRYNYFVRPKPIAAGALRVRITAQTGETLEDRLPEPQSGLSIEGHAQFR